MKNYLKEIRKAKGLTLQELSHQSGIPLSTIGNFETGRCGASILVLNKLAATLQVSIDQILSGILPTSAIHSQPNPSSPNVHPIPIVSWAHAGEAADYADLCNQIDESITTFCPDANAFGLIIEGDSMEPLFYEGDRVLFLPNTEALNGDYVVARFAEDYGVVFKKFKRIGADGNTILLESLNPAYSPIQKHASQILFCYPAFSQFRFLRK